MRFLLLNICIIGFLKEDEKNAHLLLRSKKLPVEIQSKIQNILKN